VSLRALVLPQRQRQELSPPEFHPPSGVLACEYRTAETLARSTSQRHRQALDPIAGSDSVALQNRNRRRTHLRSMPEQPEFPELFLGGLVSQILRPNGAPHPPLEGCRRCRLRPPALALWRRAARRYGWT